MKNSYKDESILFDDHTHAVTHRQYVHNHNFTYLNAGNIKVWCILFYLSTNVTHFAPRLTQNLGWDKVILCKEPTPLATSGQYREAEKNALHVYM